MKKITLLFVVFFALLGVISAQAPQKFRYQAVARDVNNLPYNNATLRIRFMLLEDANNGPIRYFEEHIVTTSALGLFEVNIGDGTVIQGNMSDIAWGGHPYFVRVELNPNVTGGSFVLMGVSQLLSVPYALYAAAAGGGVGNNQQLSLNSNQLSISGGNTVTLPDASSTNEIQSLALNGNTLSLSNGGGSVTLPSSGGGFSLPYTGSASDPDAVFEVTNDGPGIGVLATSTDAGYAGMVTYNTGSGTAASLAGPDYGGYFSGPIRVQSIGTNAPLLEIYDASGTVQTYMGSNNANAWELRADDYGFLINSPSTNSFLDIRAAGITANAEGFYLYAPGGGGLAHVIADNTSAGLSMTNASANNMKLLSDGSFFSWTANGASRMDMPFFQNVLEPWYDFGMDMGTSIFRWNTLYAASTNLASDRRLKENIKPTQYGLSTVMQLRPVDYFWKDKKMSEKQQTGFIAQELETVMPDVVSHDTMTPEQIEACKKAGKPVPEITDPYGVNYDAIIPVLVKGMQEQQQLIEQLQQQNQLLVKRIEAIEHK